MSHQIHFEENYFSLTAKTTHKIKPLRKSEVRLRIAGHLFCGIMTERGTALNPGLNLLFYRRHRRIVLSRYLNSSNITD